MMNKGLSLNLIAVLLFAIFIVSNSYKKDGKCYKPMNLVIALDASSSIESSTWQTEINVAKQVIASNAIDNSGNQFAIIDFSTIAGVAQPLTSNASEAISALEKLKTNFKDGHTYIDAALKEAANLFQSAHGAKEETQNVLLTITDGYMTYHNGEDIFLTLVEETNKLKAANVTSFAYAVGKQVKHVTLYFIATDPVGSHVFENENAIQLTESIRKAVERPCKDGEGEEVTKTVTCGAMKLKKVGTGCYKDNQAAPRPLPDLLFTDRDASSGHSINWASWDTYLPDFVCRCANETAKRNRTIFGVQFYGECWSSASTDTYAKDGPTEAVGNCLSLKYLPCNGTSPYCVGTQSHNYIYNVTGSN